MTRVAKMVTAFVVIGGIAALSVTDSGPFMMGFFVLVFGGVAAVVAGVAGTASSESDDESTEADQFIHQSFTNHIDHDTFHDQDGVRHASPQGMQRG